MIRKRYAVFIPCYNAASTIEETLTSVQKAIAVLNAPVPVFVHDDCSKDASPEIVQRFAQQHANFFLHQNKQNSGERKTTNAAFAGFRQQFDWIFIIHADDTAKENWLSTLVRYIEEENDAACFTAWSSFDVLFEKDNSIQHGETSGEVARNGRDRGAIRKYIIKTSASWHLSGAAINTELYCKLNGFDEKMPQFGDTDFFVKGLLAGYTDVYIAASLTTYRISAGGVSSVSFRTNRDIREMHMMMERYREILGRQGLASMHAAIARISSRRAAKWLLQGKLRLAFNNMFQLIRTTAGLIRLNINPNVGK